MFVCVFRNESKIVIYIFKQTNLKLKSVFKTLNKKDDRQ